MGNSILRKQLSQKNSRNSISNMIGQLKSMGPSNAVFNQMYNSNPQFRNFANSVRGKTPEEAFKQKGLDFNDFRNLKW